MWTEHIAALLGGVHRVVGSLFSMEQSLLLPLNLGRRVMAWGQWHRRVNSKEQ